MVFEISCLLNVLELVCPKTMKLLLQLLLLLLMDLLISELVLRKLSR
jgi:hypothetical protein